MTRNEFMTRLRQGLVGLNPDYIRDVMNDYESHFDDGRQSGRSEEEISAALGDPGRLARELRAEAGFQRWENARTPGNLVGAVLGLIHVMENLSNPSKLGSGIAVAFVATVYGVGSANLLFLPIASKLKHLVAAEVAMKELVVEGVAAIANGENPRIIESRLKGFLAMHE
jgi:flagellar motor component MotA